MSFATNGFLASLGLTLVLLALVLWTGHHAKLRAHFILVACAVVGLGVTIYFAERLGQYYDLHAAGRIYPVHLLLAKTATASYLLPLGTGLATLRNRKYKPWHRRAAFFTLALTVLAAGTGTWMVVRAPLLAS